MKVVVVGGGPAGIAAAVTARRLGADVTLLERDRLGGVCFNEGPVPVRTLARTARMMRDAGAWSRFGLAGAPPALDLGAALENCRRAMDEIHLLKHAAETLQAKGIDVAEGIGPVRFVDPHKLAVADGRLVSADRIILAVGGHDRRLSLPGVELGLSYRDVLQLKTLPERVAVVGGAATGCQLASIFADFGARVTLVEAAPRIVPGEDVDIGETLGRAFSERGIEVVTRALVQRLTRTPQGIQVDVARGEGAKASRLEVDAVFFAVGWPGNLDELHLGAAGIESARDYIRVDAQLCTSQPHVFAVGDVNGIRKLVQTAIHQGSIAAENAVLGRQQRYHAAFASAGSFTDPEYASVGLTEEEARRAGPCVVARYDHRALTRAVVDGRVTGFCKLIADARTGALIGAHVLGEYSAEIIQVAAVAMAAKVSARELAASQFAYPTFTQAIELAALRLALEQEQIPREDAFDVAELDPMADGQ